jgi:hypothetical protein
MKLLCPYCHSDNIARAAAARWNPETKDWELSCVHDDMTCDDCGESFYEAEEGK